jgi:hypothetical protein
MLEIIITLYIPTSSMNILCSQIRCDQPLTPGFLPRESFHLLKRNAATQTDDERPFVSANTENASGLYSSGVTQSDPAVRADANLAQICVRFVFSRTLHGHVERPPFLTRSRTSGATKLMDLAFNLWYGRFQTTSMW